MVPQPNPHLDHHDELIIKGPKFPYKQEMSLGRHLLDCLNKHGDAIAQIYAPTGEKYTFNDLKSQSIRVATNMTKILGVKRNDVISMCSANTLQTCLPLLSGLYVGAVISPLDPSLSKYDIKHLLVITKPKFVFTSTSCLDVIEQVLKQLALSAKIIVFGETDKHMSFNELLQGETDENYEPVNFKDPHDHIAFLMSSSGTTGLPKCVEITHGALLMQAQLVWHLQLKGFTLLNMSTLFWISGVIVAINSIDRAIIRLLTPPFNAAEALQNIEKYKVDWMVTGVTYFCRMVTESRAQNYELGSLKIISVGGGKVSKYHQELGKKVFPNANFSSAFGMTETAGACFQLNSGKPSSIGLVMPGVEAKIRSLDSDKSLGPNKVGELCLRGNICFKAYHDNPQATAATIQPDNWIHTGDLAYYDEDKCFYIEGRIKEQFKSRGWALSCLELETALLEHPDIEEAAVVGVPHPEDVTRPRAFIVKRQKSQIDEISINKHMEERLSVHKQITGGVVFLDTLPLTPTGKVQKRTLLEMSKTEMREE